MLTTSASADRQLHCRLLTELRYSALSPLLFLSLRCFFCSSGAAGSARASPYPPLVPFLAPFGCTRQRRRLLLRWPVLSVARSWSCCCAGCMSFLYRTQPFPWASHSKHRCLGRAGCSMVGLTPMWPCQSAKATLRALPSRCTTVVSSAQRVHRGETRTLTTRRSPVVVKRTARAVRVYVRTYMHNLWRPAGCAAQVL